MLQRISDLSKVKLSKIYNVYSYGSRVYQTASFDSDYDFLVVCETEKENVELRFKEGIQIGNLFNEVNIHLFSIKGFQQLIEEHKINFLESYFLPEAYKLKEEHQFSFELDLPKLRKEISSKSSNSWVKCKKKLTVEEDAYYIGIKSLFHSLRILKFGMQIAKFGKIIDYTEANPLWEEISLAGKQKKNWEYFKDKYQKLYNSLATDFRKLAPKKENENEKNPTI